MRIRIRQIEKMSAAAQEDYHRRLADFFRKTLPQYVSTYTDPELVTLVEQGQQKALEYSIQSELAVVKFIGLCIIVNPTFYAVPSVHEYLSNVHIDADLRMKLLFDQLEVELKEK